MAGVQDEAEVEHWVAVTAHRLQRRARRLRAEGKPAPTDTQIEAVAIRRNQPEGTRRAPRSSDHLYEAISTVETTPADPDEGAVSVRAPRSLAACRGRQWRRRHR